VSFRDKRIVEEVKFCCVHPELMDVFKLHQAKGSEPLFEIFPEEEAALKSF
jgi:hypothetical protein